MASQKYVIVSDCRLNGRVLRKGSTLDLDIEDPREGQQIAILNRSGRIGLATRENIAAIQAEIDSEKERDKTLARFGGKSLAPA